MFDLFERHGGDKFLGTVSLRIGEVARKLTIGIPDAAVASMGVESVNGWVDWFWDQRNYDTKGF